MEAVPGGRAGGSRKAVPGSSAGYVTRVLVLDLLRAGLGGSLVSGSTSRESQGLNCALSAPRGGFLACGISEVQGHCLPSPFQSVWVNKLVSSELRSSLSA